MKGPEAGCGASKWVSVFVVEILQMKNITMEVNMKFCFGHNLFNFLRTCDKFVMFPPLPYF